MIEKLIVILGLYVLGGIVYLAWNQIDLNDLTEVAKELSEDCQVTMRSAYITTIILAIVWSLSWPREIVLFPIWQIASHKSR